MAALALAAKVFVFKELELDRAETEYDISENARPDHSGIPQ